ncbi:tetratricopeptide repeat protein, partial [Desulfosarcina sp. OttesenSCG-928-B08]|nr:tetratricopeptide repeat protein [Desulfosarcina sp. OttesenSCG-928-B08]
DIAVREQAFGEAQRMAEALLAETPDNYQARLILGNAFMGQGKTAEAEMVFKLLVAGDSKNPVGYYRLGLVQRMMKNDADALKNFNAALELNPLLMDVFTSLVMLYGANNELDTALTRCDAQLEKVGDSALHKAIINNLKGAIFLAQKKNEEAQKAFDRAIQHHPEYMPPYYALARMAVTEKRPKDAIDRYTAILEKAPDQVMPHMLIGTIYDMQRQYDQSEVHYRAALNVDPQFAPAANNLAYLLTIRNGNLDEALKFAQIAKERMPEDASVMDTLGWVYYKKGLYDSAIQEFMASLEKMPDNPTVIFHLGAALFKKGDTEKAKSLLEKALKLSDQFDGADEAKKILSEI